MVRVLIVACTFRLTAGTKQYGKHHCIPSRADRSHPRYSGVYSIIGLAQLAYSRDCRDGNRLWCGFVEKLRAQFLHSGCGNLRGPAVAGRRHNLIH